MPSGTGRDSKNKENDNELNEPTYAAFSIIISLDAATRYDVVVLLGIVLWSRSCCPTGEYPFTSRPFRPNEVSSMEIKKQPCFLYFSLWLINRLVFFSRSFGLLKNLAFFFDNPSRFIATLTSSLDTLILRASRIICRSLKLERKGSLARELLIESTTCNVFVVPCLLYAFLSGFFNHLDIVEWETCKIVPAILRFEGYQEQNKHE